MAFRFSRVLSGKKRSSVMTTYMAQLVEEAVLETRDFCSDAALRTKVEGSLEYVLLDLVKIAGTAWLLVLQAHPHKDKLPFILQNTPLMSSIDEVMLKLQPSYRPKNAQESTANRQESAAAIDEGDRERALELATQAVLWAPIKDDVDPVEDRVSLLWALWMRVEVLLECKRYAAALNDLKEAFKEGIPTNLRGEYYWLLGECNKGIGKIFRAQVSYEIAIRYMTESNHEMKARVEIDMRRIKNYLVTIPPLKKPAIELTGGAKKTMPALSNLVKITAEEKKGLFAVAESSIKTGDVLLIDSPYAACLQSEFYGTHCENCFKRFADCVESAPMWCPTCSGVAFCSVQCRDAAVGSYHLYECQFMDMFKGPGFSTLNHIALRMITQSGLQKSLSIHQKYIANDNRNLDVTAPNYVEANTKGNKKLSKKERLRNKKSLVAFEEKYLARRLRELNAEDKTNYDDLEAKAAQVYLLNIHTETRNGADYLKKYIMAILLCECLKSSTFFDSCENEADKTTAYRAITELIERNIQILQFNAYQIYESLYSSHTHTVNSLNIGWGIYPTGALINHSCYPAAIAYYEGRNRVLTAVRPLEPGEEVSESYGPHFMIDSRQNRQISLTIQHSFTCHCTACDEHWPTIKDIKPKCTYYKCQNPSCRAKCEVDDGKFPSKCDKCKSRIDPDRMIRAIGEVDKCREQYESAAQMMADEKFRGAIAAIGPAVDKFHQLAYPPHFGTHVVQAALKTCIAMQGNVHRMKQPLEVRIRRKSI